MENKWKEFLKWAEECYLTMTGKRQDRECWDRAFTLLKEIVSAERSAQPERIIDPFQLDEDTDYEYDVQGWLGDFLNDMDTYEEYEKLLSVCEELLHMFRGGEGMVSKVKFMKMSALVALERTDEALQFSRQWLEEEGDNMDAIAANIYSYTAVRDMKTADELVRRHIPEGTKCRSKNNILFAAASTLYEEAGNEKEKNRIDQEIAAYIERLKDYYMGGVKEKNGSPQDDDELPF